MRIYNSSYIRKDQLKKDFNTFLVNPKEMNYISESHIYVTSKEDRKLLADDIFKLIDCAYDDIGGFKPFKDMQHFIDDSYLWYITYDGDKPDKLDDFDINRVYTVSVFRKKFGLKMVGMACNTFPNISKKSDNFSTLRNHARAALLEHIKFVAQRGWAELSGKLETYFSRALPCKYIIIPEILRDEGILSNIDVDIDGLHYYRSLRKGEDKIQKIAYGTIRY